MNEATTPIVTIGLPVYNGAATLRGVLDSIALQTYRNFTLIISDNASTDGTETICREFQLRDSRIVYVRQPRNLGAAANFNYVLDHAKTPYFMWAAADDIRSSDFIDLNLSFLEMNPEFIGSISPVRFEGGEFDPTLMGDHTRDEADPYERIVRFAKGWHANGLVYCLFRTEVLRNIRCSTTSFLGGDWVLIMNLLARGKFKRLNSGFVELGKKGESNSLNALSSHRNRLICWIFPFFDLSMSALTLLRRARLRQKATLCWNLLRLNYYAFKLQIRYEARKAQGQL
jgi:glycosyltransferase involved in cell wall biosynthesis